MMLPNGWKKVGLFDVVSIESTLVDPKKEPYSKMNLIAPDHIQSETGVVLALVPAKEQYAISGKYLVKKGDVIYSKIRPYLKKACKASEECLCSADMYPLTVSDQMDSSFLLHMLLSETFTKYANSCSARTGIPKINREDLALFQFYLPPIEEQKKIAATLLVWDSAIEKMKKLIDAKEISFNSLLKELIYAPAEKECWNIVKLGDVSEMSSGGTPKSSVEKYYNGDVLWVSIADMTEQGMYIKDTAKKLTKLGVENSAAKIYPKGTVLYAMYASIGEVSIAEKEMASSQAILGIQVSDKLVNKYLYYFLVGQKERIKLQGQAGTQSNLNAGMVKNLDIPIPSIKEQNKIIAVLDNGMDELSLLKQQLENYKKQKQGLMQKLLTGQWRVK